MNPAVRIYQALMPGSTLVEKVDIVQKYLPSNAPYLPYLADIIKIKQHEQKIKHSIEQIFQSRQIGDKSVEFAKTIEIAEQSPTNGNTKFIKDAQKQIAKRIKDEFTAQDIIIDEELFDRFIGNELYAILLYQAERDVDNRSKQSQEVGTGEYPATLYSSDTLPFCVYHILTPAERIYRQSRQQMSSNRATMQTAPNIWLVVHKQTNHIILATSTKTEQINKRESLIYALYLSLLKDFDIEKYASYSELSSADIPALYEFIHQIKFDRDEHWRDGKKIEHRAVEYIRAFHANWMMIWDEYTLSSWRHKHG
jgi:hypothetical protein